MNEFDSTGLETSSISERDLVSIALSISSSLDKRDTTELYSFLGAIEEISTIYGQIIKRIQCEHGTAHSTSAEESARRQQETPDGSDGSDTHQTMVSTSLNLGSESTTQQHNRVRSLLVSAVEFIPQITEAAWRFKSPSSVLSLNTLRMLHIQHIRVLQRRRTTIDISSPVRILTMCACRSLALDYYDFETFCGHQPKEDVISERILLGAELNIQSISKCLGRFIDEHFCEEAVDRAGLEAALRFGIKLGVVDAIGRSIGIKSLPLLLGFGFNRLARMPFAAMTCLRDELNQPDISVSLQYFTYLMDTWWADCQFEYHAKFRSFQTLQSEERRLDFSLT